MSVTSAARGDTAQQPLAHRRPLRPVIAIGPLRLPRRTRLMAVGLCLTVIAVVLFLADIAISDYPMTLADVVRILFGGGTRVQNVIVFDVQLPRALVAALVGLGLGYAGSLTQVVTRNPLASPDMIGITAGASTFAVLAIAFGSTWGSWLAGVGVPVAAIIGAAVAAVAMYLLAWRRGIESFRLVLVGVALTWMFEAITSYLLTRAQINDAARAQQWLVGSVNNASWSDVWPLVITVAVALALVGPVSRSLSALSLGPDVAAGLGASPGRGNTLVLGLGVVISAMCVAAAGPIAFVALLAPQIGARLARTPTPTPTISGLVGATLVLLADVVCRTVLPSGLPVGIVTAAVGGPFLIYLMIRVSRKATV